MLKEEVGGGGGGGDAADDDRLGSAVKVEEVASLEDLAGLTDLLPDLGEAIMMWNGSNLYDQQQQHLLYSAPPGPPDHQGNFAGCVVSPEMDLLMMDDAADRTLAQLVNGE